VLCVLQVAEGGVRRPSTREDIRRKLANFGEEEEDKEEEESNISVNNNLEVGISATI